MGQYTPPKMNIEPENGGLEDDFGLPGAYSQVPCESSGVYQCDEIAWGRKIPGVPIVVTDGPGSQIFGLNMFSKYP